MDNIQRNPEYYEQKANQLRLENEILRRQLENNSHPGSAKYTVIQPPKTYSAIRNPANYAIHTQVPLQQVIYNPVSEPIRPPSYSDSPTSFQNQSPNPNTQFYLLPQRQQHYSMPYLVPSGDWERKAQINQVEQQIVGNFCLISELQDRGYKLQRQANRLSSFIKEDLRDFIRDSNIHKDCTYKHKYIKAISNRPRYFKFHI